VDEAVERGFATGVSGKASDKAMASVRLDHLKDIHIPQRLAQARERHPDLIPKPRPAPQQRAAAAVRHPDPSVPDTTTFPHPVPPGREGQAAPRAVEVTPEIPMTATATAGTNPAETVNPPAPAQASADVLKMKADLDAAQARIREMEEAKAEDERVTEITRMCVAPHVVARLPQGFAKGLIDKKVKLDDARTAIINKMVDHQDETQGEIRTQVRVEAGVDASEKRQEGITNAILTMSGSAALVAKATGKKIDPGEFRGLSAIEMARHSLADAGIDHRGWHKIKVMGEALTLRARGLAKQGTSDFTVALESAMSQTMLAAYNETPDTWQRFCAVGSVSDFRAHTRYRPGSFGTLDVVNELAEFKHKPIPDAEKVSISIGTKGNLISVSRQALINDQMDYIAAQAADLGRMARYSIEVDVYTLLELNSGLGPTLADGLTLFHATHGNIATTAAVPTVTSFDAARTLIGSQLSPSGTRFITIRPPYVWVGPLALGSTVRVLNQATYDPSVSNKFQMPNAVAGMLADVVDTPQLAGTRWYLFANPTQNPTIEVAFLDGVQTPFLDTMEGWTVDGTEWKVRLDYGVAAVDYRGAMTNAGTA
jgi:hypothetical protein